MKKSEDIVLSYLNQRCNEQRIDDKNQIVGCTTKEIADALSLQRTNVSAVLNKLCDAGKVYKIKGKPIVYATVLSEESEKSINVQGSFDTLIGKVESLKKCIQQAKATILYPPNGLHTLLLGPTGVGKTMFAELMYKFTIEKAVISYNAPFVAFNCADYANNPQLLLAHLFGCKKGAFTGADKDRLGLVDKANGGILFLDDMPDHFFDNYEMPGRKMNVYRGWEIYEKGIYDIAVNLKENYGNIESYISENGMGVQDEERFIVDGRIEDNYRIDFLKDHLIWLHKSIEEGCNVKGYHMWTFIDNWSWSNAYKNRYGFIQLDLKTQKRIIKKSGYWMKEVLKNNGF